MNNRWRITKRVAAAVASIATIGGVVYLFFFADMNHYVVDYMLMQGLHPDPESKDFTAIDGIFRLAYNFGIIAAGFSVAFIAGIFLIMAISDTTFAEMKAKKNAPADSRR